MVTINPEAAPNRWVGTYHFSRLTKTKAVFLQDTKGGPLRAADIGNLYLTQTLWKRLGQPLALRLTAVPISVSPSLDDTNE